MQLTEAAPGCSPWASSASGPAPPSVQAVAGRDRASVNVQDVGLAVAAHPEPAVIRRNHPRRGDHPAEAAITEKPASPVDELTRQEVPEPRSDVVELDLGHTVACVADQHHANRLVATLDDVCRTARSRLVPHASGLEPLDVAGMDPQQ